VQIRRVSLRGTSSFCLLGPNFDIFLGGQTDLHNQLLFTAGMTLLDSIDSILMLYSYTGFAEHRFNLFEPARENDAPDGPDQNSAYQAAAAASVAAARIGHETETEHHPLDGVPPALGEQSDQKGPSSQKQPPAVEVQVVDADDARIRDIRREAQRELIVKRNMMSGLSILLTLMSIIVAFRCEFSSPSLTATAVDRIHR
jgi:high-affinity nickel-transport protein